MERNNILAVLQKLLTENRLPCEWFFDWQEPNEYFELQLQFSWKNEKLYRVEDSNHKVSTHPFVYEVSLFFYQEEGLAVSGEPYLRTFGVNARSGIPYGELLAIVHYLKQLALDANLAWREAYQKTLPFNFEIHWQEDRFEAIKRSLKESYRYSETKVFFPIR